MLGLKNSVVLVAVAVALAGPVGFRLGYDSFQARFAGALEDAIREKAAAQKELMRAVERVGLDAEIERQEIENRLAGANDAVNQLQRAVDLANDGTDTGPACVSDAGRARALLAQCAASYRDMAREADRHRATVLGLQNYVREILRSRE